MSWYLQYKKYKKLAKQLIYERSELEFVNEVLKEYHKEFDLYQVEFCQKNDIDLKKMRNDNAAKTDKIFRSPVAETDEQGVVLSEKKNPKQKKQSKCFSRLYKLIAKKIHPDKLANRFRTEEIVDKEEQFKVATSAFDNCDWGKLLEVSEELKIKPVQLEELCEEIYKETKVVKDKIRHAKKTFSWYFYECNNEDNIEQCRDNLMFSYYKQLFNFGK